MKKFIYIFSLVLIAAAIYAIFFIKKERKASIVRENLVKIYSGMSTAKVRELLTAPDTIYPMYYTRYGAVQIFQYYQGLGAPDVVRVLIRRDTVVAVITND